MNDGPANEVPAEPSPSSPASPSPFPMAGWWPDPAGRHEFRYHNGSAWTADVADGGDRFVDPYGAGPSPVSVPPSSTPGRTDRAATTSLVFGVIAAATGLIPFVFVVGAVAAIVAIVLGVIGVRRARPDGAGRSRAVIGLVTGALGVLAAIGGGVLTVIVVDAVDRYENAGAHEIGPMECSADGDAWTARTSITNLENDARSYTVTIEFRRPGTDNVGARTRVRIDDLAPGSSEVIEATRVVDLDDVDCVVADVDGPAPFGIDFDG